MLLLTTTSPFLFTILIKVQRGDSYIKIESQLYLIRIFNQVKINDLHLQERLSLLAKQSLNFSHPTGKTELKNVVMKGRKKGTGELKEKSQNWVIRKD